MKTTIRRAIAAATVTFAFVVQTQADAPTASSDFECGPLLQGWTQENPIGWTLSTTAFGNPGFCISATDTSRGGTNLFVRAPVQFTGDLYSYDGVQWDEFVPDYGTNTMNSTAVYLVGTDGTRYANIGSLGALNTWRTRYVTFSSSNWVLVSGTTKFDDVRGSVQGLLIQMETAPGQLLQSRVDNILLTNPLRHGVLGFSASIYEVNENAGSATITVTRTNGSIDPVTVQFANTNGSATAPDDFAITNGTLRFLSGETSKTFTVKINNDLAVEPEETVSLRLFGATGGATLGRTNATLLIFDDDNGPGSVSFSSENFNVIEGTDPNLTNYASISVRRTGGRAGTLAVDAYTVELPPDPGVATAGVDYVATTNHLVFTPGTTNLIFRVPIIPDGLPEANEILRVALTNVTSGTIGFISNAILTIVDDDSWARLTIRLSTNRVELSVPTKMDVPYQVQWTTDLPSSVWTGLNPVSLGDGSPTTVTDSIGAAQMRFYRIQVGSCF